MLINRFIYKHPRFAIQARVIRRIANTYNLRLHLIFTEYPFIEVTFSRGRKVRKFTINVTDLRLVIKNRCEANALMFLNLDINDMF